MQKGLAEYLILKCSWCGYETNFSTSMKIKLNNSTFGSTHDFNACSAYASQMMGREGLSKFCSIMDMSPPTKVISSTAVNKAESAMKKKHNRISLCVDEYPEDTFVNNNCVIGANMAVSIDGTWQKRGHNSKTGVVFAISIITGEVLDCEVKALFC